MFKKTIIFLVLSACYLSAFSNSNLAGYWKTIDDATGEVKSVVQIYKTDKGLLEGKIIKIFPKEGEDPNPVCDKCSGIRKDKPIIGMLFMWDFKLKEGKWVDGNILDPDNGKTYHCSLTLNDEGTQLEVYGYIKLIFKIGRRQTWIRTTNPQKE